MDDLDSLDKFEKDLEDLSTSLTNHFKIPISREKVFHAIFVALGDELEMEWLGDVYDANVEYDSLYHSLKDFDFSMFDQSFESDYEMIQDVALYQEKVKFKVLGAVWYMHKNDKDPFPSNPHAHQLEDNLKLDLSNGKLFRKRTCVKQLKKKDLLILRELAHKVFEGELPALTI